MSKFKDGDRVRTTLNKVGTVDCTVDGIDTMDPDFVKVVEDNGQYWYISPQHLKLDDGVPFPPKGHVQVGWMQEIVYVDGPCRSYFDGESNKPTTYKDWKHSDLLEKIVVSERIFPVFSPL